MPQPLPSSPLAQRRRWGDHAEAEVEPGARRRGLPARPLVVAPPAPKALRVAIRDLSDATAEPAAAPAPGMTDGQPADLETVAPRLCVAQTARTWLALVHLPGVRADEVRIDCGPGTLTVVTAGARRYHAILKLPEPVEDERGQRRLSASFRAGVLDIRLGAG